MRCRPTHVTALLAALVALAAGCPRKTPPASSAVDSAPAADRMQAAPPDARPPKVPVRAVDGAAASQPAGPPAPLGLEPCDSYLEQHHRCITRRLPADLRPMALEGLASTRAAWQRALKANEVARLRLSCAATADATRKAMKRYGCRY